MTSGSSSFTCDLIRRRGRVPPSTHTCACPGSLSNLGQFDAFVGFSILVSAEYAALGLPDMSSFLRTTFKRLRADVALWSRKKESAEVTGLAKPTVRNRAPGTQAKSAAACAMTTTSAASSRSASP